MITIPREVLLSEILNELALTIIGLRRNLRARSPLAARTA